MKNDRSGVKIHAAMLRAGGSTLVGSVLLALGCATRSPQLWLGPLAGDGLDRFVTAHGLAPGQEIRADLLERNAGASHHLVQIATAERPHVHASHDLQVLLVAGRGTLHVAERTMTLCTGDVATIARGTPHWFVREGDVPAAALVTFTPPLDAPDNVPVAVDSGATRR